MTCLLRDKRIDEYKMSLGVRLLFISIIGLVNEARISFIYYLLTTCKGIRSFVRASLRSEGRKEALLQRHKTASQRSYETQ